MIILDTNVLSALMRERPDPTVVAWLDSVPAESVWTTSITVFEIGFGLEIMAKGRRRARLEREFGRLIEEDIERRVLPFDGGAAGEAACLAATARALGRSVEVQDVQIAGIARLRRGSLATGNVHHFADMGISVIDPWQRAAL